MCRRGKAMTSLRWISEGAIEIRLFTHNNQRDDDDDDGGGGGDGSTIGLLLLVLLFSLP